MVGGVALVVGLGLVQLLAGCAGSQLGEPAGPIDVAGEVMAFLQDRPPDGSLMIEVSRTLYTDYNGPDGRTDEPRRLEIDGVGARLLVGGTTDRLEAADARELAASSIRTLADGGALDPQAWVPRRTKPDYWYEYTLRRLRIRLERAGRPTVERLQVMICRPAPAELKSIEATLDAVSARLKAAVR